VSLSGAHIYADFGDQAVSVDTVEQLLQASGDGTIKKIKVNGFLSGVPSFRLAPGQAIVGQSPCSSGLKFLDDADGIELSSNNSVSSLTLLTSPAQMAIKNDESVEDLGTPMRKSPRSGQAASVSSISA